MDPEHATDEHTDRQAPEDPSRAARDRFLAEADATPTLMGDLTAYFRESRKWWLLPIVLALVTLGALLLLSTTAAGPFIYSLF